MHAANYSTQDSMTLSMFHSTVAKNKCKKNQTGGVFFDATVGPIEAIYGANIIALNAGSKRLDVGFSGAFLLPDSLGYNLVGTPQSDWTEVHPTDRGDQGTKELKLTGAKRQGKLLGYQHQFAMRIKSGSAAIDWVPSSILDYTSSDIWDQSRLEDGDGDGSALRDVGAFEYQ